MHQTESRLQGFVKREVTEETLSCLTEVLSTNEKTSLKVLGLVSLSLRKEDRECHIPDAGYGSWQRLPLCSQ